MDSKPNGELAEEIEHDRLAIANLQKKVNELITRSEEEQPREKRREEITKLLKKIERATDVL